MLNQTVLIFVFWFTNIFLDGNFYSLGHKWFQAARNETAVSLVYFFFLPSDYSDLVLGKRSHLGHGIPDENPMRFLFLRWSRTSETQLLVPPRTQHCEREDLRLFVVLVRRFVGDLRRQFCLDRAHGTLPEWTRSKILPHESRLDWQGIFKSLTSGFVNANFRSC